MIGEIDRERWGRIADPLVAEPELSPLRWSGDARRAVKALSALRARALGRPGLYRPALPRLFLQSPGWGSPSLRRQPLLVERLEDARLKGAERTAAAENEIHSSA